MSEEVNIKGRRIKVNIFSFRLSRAGIIAYHQRNIRHRCNLLSFQSISTEASEIFRT